MKQLLSGFILILATSLMQLNIASALELDSGEQQVTLLELFTSQGCSSCPPAESWLNAFTGDDRLWKEIVPLAFHVDYWDYLGWKDPFAMPEFSNRQRLYRQNGKVRAVYTPGFVVNGKEWKGWFSRDELPRRVEAVGKLIAKINGNEVTARFTSGSKPMLLHVAILGSGIRQPVAAGENAGKTLPQEFVVLGHSSHRSDTSEWQVRLPSLKVNHTGRLAVALWVTTRDDLAPMQATGGWLPANHLIAD